MSPSGFCRPLARVAVTRKLPWEMHRLKAWLVVPALVLVAACSRTGSAENACADPPPASDFHMSLFAIDAETGALRWEQDGLALYANLYTHIEDGRVIVSNGGTGRTFEIESGTEGPPPPGTVPTPLKAGATRSTSSVPGYLHPATSLDGPYLAGASAVVVSGAGDGEHNGELVAYDESTGEQRWSFPLDRPSHSPPLVHGGVVLVTTGDSTPSCV